jgi:hypothetical protein
MSVEVSRRARQREDRAGDPLDGLVNLFDLGIVMSVAFLLAALASVKLTPQVLEQNKRAQVTVPRDAVVVRQNERSRSVKLDPGAKVVGQGERVGVVYRLKDGRTVIVERKP